LLERADLLVAVGLDTVEPSPRLWAPALPLLQLAPASAEVAGSARVAGDVSHVLEELAGRIRGATRADWDVAELDRLKRGAAARALADGGVAARLARAAREMTPAGALASLDRGPHVPAVMAGWHAVDPREFLTPGGLVPCGFGVAAAVAGLLGRPGQPAVCFTDPAALAGATASLDVARARSLPVVVRARGRASRGAGGGGPLGDRGASGIIRAWRS
jgi:thiamine pyrophosphate-dependent acetolactate synthase large subunit-like protein